MTTCFKGEFRRLLPIGEWAAVEKYLPDDEDDDSRPWEDDLARFDRAFVRDAVSSVYGTWTLEDRNNWVLEPILAEAGQRRAYPRGNRFTVNRRVVGSNPVRRASP